VALALWAGPALAFTEATVRWLSQPQDYVRAVLDAGAGKGATSKGSGRGAARSTAGAAS
jgi:multicomponent K+:H+ antiporter subunit D